MCTDCTPPTCSMLQGLLPTRPSASSADTSIALEELQDVGERYSPRVLREYFLFNGFRGRRFHIGPSSIPDFHFSEISDSQLTQVRKSISLVVPAYWLMVLAGSVLFACTVVPGLDDPTRQAEAIATANPPLLTLVLLTLALIATTGAELFTVLRITSIKQCIRFQPVLHWMSGSTGRVSVVLDLISLVLIAKVSSALLYVGLSVWILGIAFGSL